LKPLGEFMLAVVADVSRGHRQAHVRDFFLTQKDVVAHSGIWRRCTQEPRTRHLHKGEQASGKLRAVPVVIAAKTRSHSQRALTDVFIVGYGIDYARP
jgi:hypothetical protein